MPYGCLLKVQDQQTNRNPSRTDGPASTSPLVDTMTGSTTRAALSNKTKFIRNNSSKVINITATSVKVNTFDRKFPKTLTKDPHYARRWQHACFDLAT